jgi:hypothetical protein
VQEADQAQAESKELQGVPIIGLQATISTLRCMSWEANGALAQARSALDDSSKCSAASVSSLAVESRDAFA